MISYSFLPIKENTLDTSLNLWLFSSLHLQTNAASSTYKRLIKHRSHILFYNVLTIPTLQRSDRGLYKCSVSSGDKFMQQNVSVTVYGECRPLGISIIAFLDVTKARCSVFSFSDRPFIRMKPRRGSVIEVQAGQKSYRITPKIRAFPAPEVIW